MRITGKKLQSKLDTINTLLFGSPDTRVERADGGGYDTLIGRWVLDSAYGGVDAHIYSNNAGGGFSLLYSHGPKRELYFALVGAIEGIRALKDSQE